MMMNKDDFNNYRLEVRLYSGCGAQGSPYVYEETIKKGVPTVAMYYEAKKYAYELNVNKHGPVYTWTSWESPKYHVELIKVDNNDKVIGIFSSNIIKMLEQLECPHTEYDQVITKKYKNNILLSENTVSTCKHCDKKIF